MKSNIKKYPLILCNCVRNALYYLFSFGKIKINGFQLNSLWSHIVCESGQIIINDSCHFSQGTLIKCCGGNINIGTNVFINRNSNIVCMEKVYIGDYTTIGPNVCIYDHDHTFGKKKSEEKFRTKAVSIGNNVWIGSNVVILKGVTIGNDVVIGAGAVVTKDIPDNCIAMQNSKIMIRGIE